MPQHAMDGSKQQWTAMPPYKRRKGLYENSPKARDAAEKAVGAAWATLKKAEDALEGAMLAQDANVEAA